MKLALAILGSVLLLVMVAALPSAKPQIPNAKDVVSPAAYASLEPASRGSSFQLAVVLKIRNGFHINAHQASADYLIPTTLTAELPAGFRSGDVVYPNGELRIFSFTKTPLNVYEDKIVLRMPLTAAAEVPFGTQHIPLKLRYQACNNEVCLPPVKLDVDATVTVASASRPAHPELFPAR